MRIQRGVMGVASSFEFQLIEKNWSNETRQEKREKQLYSLYICLIFMFIHVCNMNKHKKYSIYFSNYPPFFLSPLSKKFWIVNVSSFNPCIYWYKTGKKDCQYDYALAQEPLPSGSWNFCSSYNVTTRLYPRGLSYALE